jgi:hypothetical protein
MNNDINKHTKDLVKHASNLAQSAINLLSTSTPSTEEYLQNTQPALNIANDTQDTSQLFNNIQQQAQQNWQNNTFSNPLLQENISTNALPNAGAMYQTSEQQQLLNIQNRLGQERAIDEQPVQEVSQSQIMSQQKALPEQNINPVQSQQPTFNDAVKELFSKSLSPAGMKYALGILQTMIAKKQNYYTNTANLYAKLKADKIKLLEQLNTPGLSNSTKGMLTLELMKTQQALDQADSYLQNMYKQPLR